MKAGNTYGQKIYTIYVKLNNISVDDGKSDVVIPTPVPGGDNVEPGGPNTEELHDNMNYVFKMIRQLIEMIMKIFESLKRK
jgi:hypothetical protein